jgi:hypothetical protein
LPAKVVNDDAFQQDKRGAFECFAGKPAPTGDCGFQLLILPLLLILICCPFPRGRTQALRRGHRGKDAAVAAPGHGWPMADGGGPPEQCRSEGMPSLSEAPNGGAKPFAYFSASGKVSRCKSETANSRNRRNGYTPNPTP